MKRKQIYIFIFSLSTISFIVGQEIQNEEIDSLDIIDSLDTKEKFSQGLKGARACPSVPA